MFFLNILLSLTIIGIISSITVLMETGLVYGDGHEHPMFKGYIEDQKEIAQICGFPDDYLPYFYMQIELIKPYDEYTQQEIDMVRCYGEQTGFDAENFLHLYDPSVK